MFDSLPSDSRYVPTLSQSLAHPIQGIFMFPAGYAAICPRGALGFDRALGQDDDQYL
jgi:hypothetical protein